jgi:hypothetical protein
MSLRHELRRTDVFISYEKTLLHELLLEIRFQFALAHCAFRIKNKKKA